LLPWLPTAVAPALRRLVLFFGKRMNPERMLQRSQQRARGAVLLAARHSAAYRELLREQGLDPDALNGAADWLRLPVLTKANTFGRFKLHQLSRPVAPAMLADVLTSSGRGGRSFGFALSTRRAHQTAWFDIDLGLQDFFNIDSHPTLLVNCLPMGVVFRSRAVTVANVSVREDMACAILRDVGPRFAQTLLCTDPLFIRPLLDHARQAGVDWAALRTSVILGEEVLVEAQRDYIAARMGIDIDTDPQRTVGSSFGIGELGLNLFFETRETIRMRRALHAKPQHRLGLFGEASSQASAMSLPALFCFNPLRCHVEVLHADAAGFGELCITLLDPQAVIPLPRYATGDWGKLVSSQACAALAGLCATDPPWLPVVAVGGRIQDRPAGLPSVESIKELIYTDHGLADQLSGAFRLHLDAAGQARLTVQALAAATDSCVTLSQRLMDLYTASQAGQAGQGGPVAINITIDVVAPEAFLWRPLLDYERKFAYVAPASAPP
jgi:phenylacetate-CoA ligase